ncbi:MAG: solute carrier family 26 protein [Gammaproteobacteria bacterium]|nr:solute carrier family 26 protein [Gammaproteobacteria bacterium]MDH5660047.1 solute carrier family 26 protein [Gammaproteobacteria bacterium]
MQSWLYKFIPALSWMSNYKKENLKGDLTAGLTVGVMLVPQGMAYAMLAGLPPIIGLYASVVPVLIYALLGTSNQLAVGPVAIVSLMTAAGVGTLANGSVEAYIVYAVLLSLMVGGMQLFMGLGRFGFLVNFLSHPVISGFTSAAALIIGLSQLKHLLGVDISRSHHIHEILYNAWLQISDVHLATLIIGIASIVTLLFVKKIKPMFPGALLVVVLSTLAVWAMGLDQSGVKIVGDVPAGLSSFSFPTWNLEAMSALLPTALAISMVGFMESISVAKAFARRNRYDVNPNQELIALGAANIASSFFKGYPVTGGFSRTAVNDQAGANTPLASIITAILIAIVLLFLTPLFYYLPKAVLAAIIMTAVFGLVDIKEIKHLNQVKRSDLTMLLITFFATLTLGIEMGILTGVAVSLLWFVVKTTRPHVAVLGQIPGTDTFKNIDRVPDLKVEDDVLVLRVDAQFYFGNASFLKDLVKSHVTNAKTKLKAIVIEAASINQLDASADAVLHELHEELAAANIKLYFANVKGPVMDVMQRSGFDKKLGIDHFFLDLMDAVNNAKNRQLAAV